MVSNDTPVIARTASAPGERSRLTSPEDRHLAEEIARFKRRQRSTPAGFSRTAHDDKEPTFRIAFTRQGGSRRIIGSDRKRHERVEVLVTALREQPNVAQQRHPTRSTHHLPASNPSKQPNPCGPAKNERI